MDALHVRQQHRPLRHRRLQARLSINIAHWNQIKFSWKGVTELWTYYEHMAETVACEEHMILLHVIYPLEINDTGKQNR